MASRGRGGGGRGRGRGIGMALNPIAMTASEVGPLGDGQRLGNQGVPQPLFPANPQLKPPLAITPQDEFLLNCSRSLLQRFKCSIYHLTIPPKNTDFERYSDRYLAITHEDNKHKLSELVAQHPLSFPEELHSEKPRPRRPPELSLRVRSLSEIGFPVRKISVSVDGPVTMDQLEKQEEKSGATEEEKKEKREEEEEDEADKLEEDDEDVFGEDDYTSNYMDVDEDAGGDDDSGPDEGPVF
eukprot:GILK01005120.1.p1 GENE.GILK01005120.1~~GILK01005120.1.p1  ORF type:complete len:241 (+),score=39.56 GILK01005120.1:50-772(+)